MKKCMKNLLAFIPAALLMAGCKVELGGADTGGDVEQPPPQNVASTPVPDSGQTQCYYDTGSYPQPYACYPGDVADAGQDGNYKINQMSFTDKGDGTIYDNVTGLTWQKCSAGKSGSDCSIGSMGAYSWSAAIGLCSRLGTGWRLPSVTELTRIVDFGTSYSTIDGTKFPGTGISGYWSSTAHANVSGYAWYVNFAQGNTWSVPQTESHYVRCVRD